MKGQSGAGGGGRDKHLLEVQSLSLTQYPWRLWIPWIQLLVVCESYIPTFLSVNMAAVNLNHVPYMPSQFAIDS